MAVLLVTHIYNTTTLIEFDQKLAKASLILSQVALIFPELMSDFCGGRNTSSRGAAFRALTASQ